MLFYKSLHHCNNEQQNSDIVDIPSIESRNDMYSVVLCCMAFAVICAAMPQEDPTMNWVRYKRGKFNEIENVISDI